MKRHAVLAIAVSLLANCAVAQSHVTVYGSLGAALRVKTHASPGGASAWALGPSPNAAGIWGVWGTEDIGGGFKAHFNLESGFDLDTGSLSYSGLNWGREALVGLTTPFGRFDAGRLQVQGLAVQPLVMADPMSGNGSFAETIWPGLYTGSRYSSLLPSATPWPSRRCTPPSHQPVTDDASAVRVHRDHAGDIVRMNA